MTPTMKSILRTLALQATLAAAVPGAQAQVAANGAPDDPSPPPPARVIHPYALSPERDRPDLESAAFLGVATSPADATLAAQLGLPEGEGLVVQEIVPGSPADGVLQRHDILLKLDDQVLVDPRQFAVLVRNHKKGDEVTLAYLRQGKQAAVAVRLAEHDVPKLSALDGEFQDGPPAFNRDEVDRALALMKGPPAERSIMIYRGGPTPDAPLIREMSVNPANSDLTYKDDKGSLHLTIKDGKKSLVATDPNGKELFSGPIDTPEDRKALPPEVRERLDRIEGMRGVIFKTGGDFQGVDTHVVRPAAVPIGLPVVPELHERGPICD